MKDGMEKKLIDVIEVDHMDERTGGWGKWNNWMELFKWMEKKYGI